MPLVILLVVALIIAALMGAVYVSGILLVFIVGGIVALLLPDKNTDPTHLEWVAKSRKQGALALGFPFGGCAGLLGLFFGCAWNFSGGSVDFGRALLVAVVFVVVGGLLGAFLGYAFGE